MSSGSHDVDKDASQHIESTPHFTKRIFLIYSGNHYDVLVWKPNSHLNVKPVDAAGKTKKFIEYFSVHDVGILQQIEFMIQRLSTHYKQSLHASNTE